MHEALLKVLRTALDGRFTIQRVIGEGAYGTVFLAEDVHNRAVALRVLRPELLNASGHNRMLRELRMIAKLSHPNLLPILDAGVAADLFFYSTPFVTGESLQDRLQRGPLDPPESLRIAHEIADALSYAHSHGVLHRDLTPANVLLHSGRAVLKDLWIARALSRALSERLTGAGRVFGTPGYMSPEQLAGEPTIDPRSDVYSLAALICEMITNHLPFEGTPIEIAARQLATSGPSRRDLPPGLPPSLIDALLKGLSRLPKDRFASATELVDACLLASAPLAGSFRRDRMVVRAKRRPATRRFGLAAGVGVLLVVIAIASGTLQWHLGVIGLGLVAAGLVLNRVFTRRSIPPTRETIRPRADHVARLREALRYQYDIDQEVGRGGMALVFLARDLRYRGRKVAVKVLRPEYALSIASERFIEEIEIMAQLSHPGILTVLDSGDADGMPFYVMQYIEGESLSARIHREGPLPVPLAVSLTRDVARALEYAHRQRIIHRDIKPENILLHEGQAVVADFGIALALDRSHDRITTRGISLGTPEFMSPEQFWDTHNVDHRTDLYSLGCVLYEMLSGKPPYSGNAQELATKHLKDPIPHVRELRAEVPETLDLAICTALAKHRDDRFESAATMMAALAA